MTVVQPLPITRGKGGTARPIPNRDRYRYPKIEDAWKTLIPTDNSHGASLANAIRYGPGKLGAPHYLYPGPQGGVPLWPNDLGM